MPMLDVYIPKFRKYPDPCTDGGEIWREEDDLWCIDIAPPQPELPPE